MSLKTFFTENIYEITMHMNLNIVKVWAWETYFFTISIKRKFINIQ